MIKMYGHVPAWGIPDLSPYVTTIDLYLRMTGLPYELELGDLGIAPYGKLPYIEDGDTVVADTSFILEHLKRTYGDPLDGGLDEKEEAVRLMLWRMMDESFYWYLIQGRYRRDEDFALYDPLWAQFFGHLSETEKTTAITGIESGLSAYWAAATAAENTLAASGHGSIVQIASIAGARMGIEFASEAYCAAKAGIVGLTRKLAKRLGPRGVRVNCIAPGVIKTPRLRFSGSDEPEFARRTRKVTPLQRLGRAEEVADLVLFLASDRSSYITGQDIAIDGGLSVATMFESVVLP